MLQIANSTPFESALFVLPDRRGVDTAYVIVKATFDLLPRPHLAEKQQPVTLADEFVGKPGESSLKCASEASIGKVGTDVVVIGDACSPDERSVSELTVSVSIGGRTQRARVVGDRQWRETPDGLRPSLPKPFTRIPLIYERTFGGKHLLDEKSERYLAEPRNPIGKGFWGKRRQDEHADVGVPNIVHPTRHDQPVGFSFVAPSWEPRVRYAGTYDEHWQRTRAPYFPEDFDLRFFNVAPPELIFERGLRGGERVDVAGMSVRGDQRFVLPTCDLCLQIRVAGKNQTPNVALTTVLLEPTNERLSLSYMGAVPCNKKVLQVEAVEISLAREPLV